MTNTLTNQKYENLDGFRAIAAIGIIMMHILANGDYGLSGGVFSVIGVFGNFVRLFFVISGFGMCCGYYTRIKNNEISLSTFYLNRYKKILPFFSLLVLMDLLFAWNDIGSLIEAFVNITLLYGFLPYGSITVIGVGWTLGIIFAFYLLFPFFVVLIWDKKCAWFSLLITFLLSYSCINYFNSSDCFMRYFFYFIAGGLLYLYREQIQRALGDKAIIVLLFCCVVSCLWFMLPSSFLLSISESSIVLDISELKSLIMYVTWMIYALSSNNNVVLSNPVTKFISSISLEIYLAHMMVFRVLEKIGLTQISQNGLVSYLVTLVLTIGGVIAFAVVCQHVIAWVKRHLKEKVWLQKN